MGFSVVIHGVDGVTEMGGRYPRCYGMAEVHCNLYKSDEEAAGSLHAEKRAERIQSFPSDTVFVG
jgi:hypothetical protein